MLAHTKAIEYKKRGTKGLEMMKQNVDTFALPLAYGFHSSLT